MQAQGGTKKSRSQRCVGFQRPEPRLPNPIDTLRKARRFPEAVVMGRI